MTAPDIFLSYNREDALAAKRFADAFAAEGLNVWWDTALRSGEAYDEVTEAALRGAKAVVVLWSLRSVVSRWVRAEATIADRCKTLVPVMIEACERPIMFELTQTAELSHWTGDTGDRPWLAFLSDVRGFVGREAEPPVETSSTPLAAPTVEETLKPGQSGSAPSLAVLPFTNRSSLPEDEVFAEGMVEDVISALSQGVNVRVLGASATATLSRAAIADLAGVGRQLGVRYLLEGNVRRVGASLRVSTQLLEAATSEVVWTGKFDRPLTELAELQEELVTEIAASLDAQVYALEMERALRKPSDITAWEAVARAMSAYRQMDGLAMQRGIEEATRAVAIAPDFGPAHAILSAALATLYSLTSPDDPAEVHRLKQMAEHALVLAPDDVSVLTYATCAFAQLESPKIGIRHAERAVRRAPGYGYAHLQLGICCIMCELHERGAAHLATAERLLPGSHLLWLIKGWQWRALLTLGRAPEALEALDETIVLNPNFPVGYTNRAWHYMLAGRETEALSQIAIARQLSWDFAQFERFTRRSNLNDPQLEEIIATIGALYEALERNAT
jgi:TolB-like protein